MCLHVNTLLLATKLKSIFLRGYFLSRVIICSWNKRYWYKYLYKEHSMIKENCSSLFLDKLFPKEPFIFVVKLNMVAPIRNTKCEHSNFFFRVSLPKLKYTHTHTQYALICKNHFSKLNEPQSWKLLIKSQNEKSA